MREVQAPAIQSMDGRHANIEWGVLFYWVSQNLDFILLMIQILNVYEGTDKNIFMREKYNISLQKALGEFHPMKAFLLLHE